MSIENIDQAEDPQPARSFILNAPLNESSLSSAGAAVVDALDRGKVPTKALTELLSDPETARIALYLPTDWLPSPLKHTYRAAYRDAWKTLLLQPDQRADFSDGDIGERDADGFRPLVIKAAHLAPTLLSKGIISYDEVTTIRQETESSFLQSSLDDAAETMDRNYPTGQELTPIRRYMTLLEVSPARAEWLDEMYTHTLARHSSLYVNRVRELNALITGDSPMQSHVALRSLARLSRQGLDVTSYTDWMQAQLSHEDPLVRDQAQAAFRHLAHGGILDEDSLEAAGVDRLRLSGNISENLTPLVPELLGRLEQLAGRPELNAKLFPVLLVGGSRLKGYANTDTSDVDTAVLVRPGADKDLLLEQLEPVFGVDMPLVVELEDTPGGVRIADSVSGVDDSWSHLVYSMAWLGDADEVKHLRGDLTKAYQEPNELRLIARRRLEQDSLQYRLMHRGYERHYPVRADDERYYPDAIDSHSTYWDDGYRRLATRLFVEKVRLPEA